MNNPIRTGDLELPALFDTDEPVFLTAFVPDQPAPTLTAAELLAMDNDGDNPGEGDDS